MAPSYLAFSDTQDEHDKSGYSTEVAPTLDRAYESLAKADLDRAERLVLPLLSSSMGVWQRLRVLYILSLADAAKDTRVSLMRSIAYVDEGLEIARGVDDMDALTLLGNQGAVASHNLQWFARARTYYMGALAALRTQDLDSPDGGDRVRTANQEFDLLVGAATDAFLCADFDDACLLIEDAHRMSLIGGQAEIRGARLEWLESLVARWRNDHWSALQHAVNAADVYTAYGSPISRARVNILLATCYLDMAMTSSDHLPAHTPPSSERNRFVDLAARPIQDALTAIGLSVDRAAEGLAMLAFARFARATHHKEDPMAPIAQCESIAHELNDVPLLAQALTARGMELTARGELGPARTSFTAALDTLKESDAKAYGVEPMSALRIEEEFRQVDR